MENMSDKAIPKQKINVRIYEHNDALRNATLFADTDARLIDLMNSEEPFIAVLYEGDSEATIVNKRKVILRVEEA